MRDDEQKEILDVLLNASSDPSFPFHILVFSRPEPVFRRFFRENCRSNSFAPNLVLNDNYNPNDDIKLYLEAKFNEIAYNYGIPAPWPSSGVISLLVENASGQFIYAATIRLSDQFSSG